MCIFLLLSREGRFSIYPSRSLTRAAQKEIFPVITTIKPLFLLLISCFILMTGYGLSNILLPVRMQNDGISVDNIGLVLSMLSVGFLIGAAYSRKLLQRVGHVRVFAMCGSLTSVAILLSGLFPDPYVLGAMRVVTGFCIACANATIDSWLSYSATEKNRGRILSINQTVLMSALFLGQFLLNVAPIDGTVLFVLSGILLSLAITPIVISKQKGPVIEDSESMSLITIAKLSPLGVVGCFYCGVIYAGLLNMLPIFASDNGIQNLELSIFMGAAIIGAIILQFPIAYLSDHFDRRKVMLGMVSTLIVACILVPFFIGLGWFNVSLFTIAVITGLSACLYPMSMSETFEKVLKSQILAAMSALLSIYALGSILGPYLASLVMKAFGSNALFMFMVIAATTLLIFIMIRMKQRSALPIEQQENFVMQTPSGAVSELDPRTDYVQPAYEQSAEVDVTIALATKNPAAAVSMAKALASRDPDNASHLAAALSTIDDINIGKLYAAISSAAPEMAVHIAEALTTASPEQAEELVDWITNNYPDQFTNIIVAIANSMPDNGIRMMELAAENMSDQGSENLLKMTEQYMTEFSDSLDDMRPVDRHAAAAEQTATELYTRLSDVSPEYSAEIALAVSGALPESSHAVTEAYVNHLIDGEDGTQNTEDATNNVEAAVSDYLSQVVETMPEQAVDVASTLVDSVPDVASDMVEMLQKSDAVDSNELNTAIEDKPR